MLISIEGCVGAGKTTVARGLAAYRGSKSLLEAFELNPFLRSFYEDPVGTALEAEFAFLLLHYHQLRTQLSTDRAEECIADFHLGKDLIYADLNLTGGARELFGDLYRLCQSASPSPDLIICLSISTELLLERILSRNRDFEMEIDRSYYATLNHAYNRFFSDYPGRKLEVRMDEWDFVRDPTLFRSLALQVDSALRTPR